MHLSRRSSSGGRTAGWIFLCIRVELPPQAGARDIRMWQCLFSNLNIGVAYGFIDIPYFTSIKEFVRMALDTKKRNKTKKIIQNDRKGE